MLLEQHAPRFPVPLSGCRAPPATHAPEPGPGPLPQSQCRSLLILTYSSPTCQDERQETGSSSSHSRSGWATLHRVSCRSWDPGGKADAGRPQAWRVRHSVPCTESLLTADHRQPGSLPPLPVTGATSSEGHPRPGAPRCPQGPARFLQPLPALLACF